MNLQCNEVDLWQTPTWITRIALYNANGKIRKPKETLFIYKEWVKNHLNGVWNNQEEYESLRDSVRDHLRDFNSIKIKEFWEI